MKKRLIIVVFTLLLSAFIVNLFLPSTAKEMEENYTVVNDIEYSSEFEKVGKSERSIHAFLNDNGEEKEFVLLELERKGILHNKIRLLTSCVLLDEQILKPSFENISPDSSWGVGSWLKHYGDFYNGVIPSNCSKMTIDGNEARLEHFSFDFNGQKADFILYWCYIESKDYPQPREVKVFDENGKEISF